MLFDEAVKEGFVPPHHRPLVLMKRDPESLLDAMELYTPPETNKWVGPGDL
jgi:predicted Rossmann-fold nucleotide-binding protein